MDKKDLAQDKKMVASAVHKHEARMHPGKAPTKLAKGGTFRASANGIAQRGKTKGTMIAMCSGGKTRK